MAVVEFLVVAGRFLRGDVKVRGGFIYDWSESRVREMGVDEMADLPEVGVVHNDLVGAQRDNRRF